MNEYIFLNNDNKLFKFKNSAKMGGGGKFDYVQEQFISDLRRSYEIPEFSAYGKLECILFQGNNIVSGTIVPQSDKWNVKGYDIMKGCINDLLTTVEFLI